MNTATHNTSSWAISTTVNEPRELLFSFVLYHLALGAARVTLYLDVPDEALEQELSAIDRCNVVSCNDAYWRDKVQRARPRSIVRRQQENLFQAYADLCEDWLFHLDGDEFLTQTTDLSIGQCLGYVPSNVQSVEFQNAERFFPQGQTHETIFDGMFRLPFRLNWGDIPPDLAKPHTTRGLAAYSQGKACHRRGENIIPGIHSARNKKGTPAVCSWHIGGIKLLHFDGLTSAHWALKLAKYNKVPGALKQKNFSASRLSQIAHVIGSNDPIEASIQLQQELVTLTKFEIDRLDALGLIFRPRNMVLDVIGDLLPEDIDISSERFNSILQSNHPDFDKIFE